MGYNHHVMCKIESIITHLISKTVCVRYFFAKKNPYSDFPIVPYDSVYYTHWRTYLACHELPHWLGIAGELLNFFGAILLAFEIILRQPERAKGRQLLELNEFVLKHKLDHVEYKGFDVASVDFPQRVLDRRAAQYGFWGVVLLGIGFLFLGGYHLLEIFPSLLKLLC